MQIAIVFSLTIFGISLCSSVTRNKEDFREINSKVPMIDNSGNVQVATSLLPMELWCNLMDFVDSQAGINMSLACKTFYLASLPSKSLHFKKVQKWLLNIKRKRNPLIQQFLMFDLENACLEISYFMDNIELVGIGKESVLTVFREMVKLKLPYMIFLNFIFQEGKQFPDVKELILTAVNIVKTYTVTTFQQIRSIFPKVSVLQLYLEFDDLIKIPFTVEEAFTAIPMLKKLIFRVSQSNSLFATRKDYTSFLEVLKNERVELKFDTGSDWMFSKIYVDTAFGIFNAELKEQEQQFKMKERLFLSVFYKDNIPKTISDNPVQIHSLVYFANNGNDSLDEIFSKIGIFTHLEKLRLNFSRGIANSNLTISGLKPFMYLSELFLNCNTSSCKSLLLSLQVVFPNLIKLRITTVILFDSWFETILKLKSLERVQFLMTTTTRKGMISLLKAVLEGNFPRLKEIKLPVLNEQNSNESNAEIVIACEQLVVKYPMVIIGNPPECCEHLF